MKKENIIFSNLYGKHDESIKGALKRGDWKNISKILAYDNSLWNIIQTNDGLETKNEIDEKDLYKIKFRYGYFHDFKHDNSNINSKCKKILSRNRNSSIIFSTRKKKNIDNLVNNFGLL